MYRLASEPIKPLDIIHMVLEYGQLQPPNKVVVWWQNPAAMIAGGSDG